MSQQDKTIQNQDIKEATETFKGLFSNLVPVDVVTITDVFGVKHEISTSVSARKQIKILRIIDDVKDIEFNFNISDETNIIEMLLSLTNNEKFLSAIGKCFDYAYPQLVSSLLEEARENGLDCEDSLDLFSIEDIVSGIIPLFIRLAKKTMGAFQKMEMVS